MHQNISLWRDFLASLPPCKKLSLISKSFPLQKTTTKSISMASFKSARGSPTRRTNIWRKFRGHCSLHRYRTISQLLTWSKNYWFNLWDIQISPLEIKLSFFWTCSTMRLTGSYKKHLDPSLERLDSISSLILSSILTVTQILMPNSQSFSCALQHLHQSWATISILSLGIKSSQEISKNKTNWPQLSALILANFGSVGS